MSTPQILGANRVVLLGCGGEVRASTAEFRRVGITVFEHTELISALIEVAHDPDSIFVVCGGYRGVSLPDLLEIAMATARGAVILGTTPGDERTFLRTAVGAGVSASVELPLMPESLLAAINRLPQRVQDSDGIVTVGDLTIDADAHRVFLGDEEVVLTLREFSILHAVARAYPRIASLDELATVYRGSAVDEPAAIRVSIRRIRAQLSRCRSSSATAIETIRGVGYRIAG